MTDYSTIRTHREGRVGVVELHRPEALNALNTTLMEELLTEAKALDASEDIGAILLIGSEKAFAAGADIKEMAEQNFAEMYSADWFSRWDELAALRTPIIAGVRGFALGGGCELAMMTDVIIAGEGAKFGQPEVNIGVIPGMGGSQRLTRSVGKAKAMDMVLTGRHIGGQEAEQIGLVSRVVPDEQVVETASEVAATIAAKSKPIIQMAKEAVSAAFETPQQQGLLFERRVFHALFSTEDQKEGMNAFSAKRSPQWKHR